VVNHCAEHIYDNQTLFTAISRKSSLTSKHIYSFQLKALLGKFKSGNWLFYPFKLKADLGKVHIPVLRQIVGAS
jgi:hypothetical protein